MIQTRILKDHNIDRLENEINYFLRGLDGSKFIDLKVIQTNDCYIAVITYKKG